MSSPNRYLLIPFTESRSNSLEKDGHSTGQRPAIAFDFTRECFAVARRDTADI